MGASEGSRAARGTRFVQPRRLENPLSDGELATKFRDTAGRVLGEGRAGELWEAPGSLGRPGA